MAFTVYDKGTASNDIQSILFQAYIDVLAAGVGHGSGVINVGNTCAVTAQGSPDMTVAVASGIITSVGSEFNVTAGNATITTADGSNPRLDFVVITSAGAIAVRAGTPAASPKPPTITAGDVVLAVVFIPASDTTISANQINDLRIIVNYDAVQSWRVQAGNRVIPDAYSALSVGSYEIAAGKYLRIGNGSEFEIT